MLELVDVQRALATGLEVNTNPGSPVVWFSLALSTLGLVLPFLVRHRTLYLIAQPAERGWNLWIGGTGGREPFAFASEFQRFVRHVHHEARRLHDSGPGQARPCIITATTTGATNVLHRLSVRAPAARLARAPRRLAIGGGVRYRDPVVPREPVVGREPRLQLNVRLGREPLMRCRMGSIWTSRYAERVSELKASEIRELLKLTQQPDIISFAGGLPAPEVFPLEEVRQATRRVLEEHGAQALQYSTTEGYEPLRQLIARHAARYGIRAEPANVLITSGSQQALDLLGKLFLDPGDTVLVEEPTYLGALQAFRAYQARFVGVPVDTDGLRPDLLEQALERERPKLLYLLPNFQNPSGVTLSESRRHAVVELAARFDVPIIEDDPYGQLRYEGEHRTPLFVLDSRRSPTSTDPVRGSHVVYTSTFSKLLAPGLRVAWILAPAEVIASLVLAKQGCDLHTSTFTQMVAYETCRVGFLDRHVRVIRKVYSERRAAMLTALEEHMPSSVQWTRPAGGLFLWITLPPELDARELLQLAVTKRVAFVPGAAFHAAGGGHNTMRLNFSYCTPQRIETGIARLADAVLECLARTPTGAA